MGLFRRDNLPRAVVHAIALAEPDGQPRRPPNHNGGSETGISAAQTLNYDVLSAIYILSWAKWKTSPVTIAAVCRHWREVALTTPQLWTKITLHTSQTQEDIEMYVNRSNGLPLDLSISEDAREIRRMVLPSSRIRSLKITDSYRYIVDHFPVLERLELVSKSHDRDVDHLAEISFEYTERFPRLRELCMLQVNYSVSVWIAKAQFGSFPPVQKLEVGCQDYWNTIVDCRSNTLVSLHLRMDSFGQSKSFELVLPQLRHLRITQYPHLQEVVLKIDAPLLESIDEGRGQDKAACTKLQLRHPKSVKHFHTGHFPLSLAPYPSLKTLWIYLDPAPDVGFDRSLARNLKLCPEITRIKYHDPTPDWTRRASSRYTHSRIQQVAGRNITVERFDPPEMNLPGSML